MDDYPYQDLRHPLTIPLPNSRNGWRYRATPPRERIEEGLQIRAWRETNEWSAAEMERRVFCDRDTQRWYLAACYELQRAVVFFDADDYTSGIPWTPARNIAAYCFEQHDAQRAMARWYMDTSRERGAWVTGEETEAYLIEQGYRKPNPAKQSRGRPRPAPAAVG
jgi:hypothetical protein